MSERFQIQGNTDEEYVIYDSQEVRFVMKFKPEEMDGAMYLCNSLNKAAVFEEPFEAHLKAGDVYRVKGYDAMQFVGIAKEVTTTNVYGCEMWATLGGEVSCVRMDAVRLLKDVEKL